MALDVATHITAAPQFQLPHGGRIPFGDGLVKRQDLTFSSCGLDCDSLDFCQGYRSNFGFCCPRSVLTRTAFNYCGPATTCVEYGVTSVSDYFYDSTRSIQYCGIDRPACATYVYTNDDYTQVFCAADLSGVYYFDTTSTAGQVATFVGTDETTTTVGRTSAPTATVVSRTSAAAGADNTASFTSDATNPPATTSASSSGDTKSGLGTGAVAGIAVGAAAIGIALAIVAFIFWRRSRKNAAKPTSNAQLPPPPPPMNMTNQYPGPGPYDPNANANAGYYQQQQAYTPIPQVQSPAPNPNQQREFYKTHYQNQAPVFELGGGGGQPQSPMYHENTEAGRRQELQG